MVLVGVTDAVGGGDWGRDADLAGRATDRGGFAFFVVVFFIVILREPLVIKRQ